MSFQLKFGPEKCDEAPDWFDLFLAPMMKLAITHLGFQQGVVGQVLDTGCGDGYRSSQLQLHAGVKIVGIDINYSRLQQAAAHYPANRYVLGNIEDLPIKECTFDAIFSCSVLQYVNWQTVVAKFERILKTNGKAVFIENLSGNPFARGFRRIHRYSRWEYAPYETPEKHIEHSELDYFKKTFGDAYYTPFHLSTPCLLAVPALKKGVFGTPMHVQTPRLYHALWRLDQLLMRAFPLISKYCWHAVVCVTKRPYKCI